MDNFEKNYKKLNPEQREAVDLIEGPVMVIAGPGTGKTQILTLRIANILIKTQVNPENILALTFSESATSEMRHRLVEIIGTAGFRVEIATFHSFANEVIKNFPENFPHLLASEAITEIEQIDILEQLIVDSELELLKPSGEQLYYLRAIKDSINDLKKEGLSVEDLEQAIKNKTDDFENEVDLYHEKGPYKGQMKGKYQAVQKEIAKSKELLLMYAFYQEQLKLQKKYDFNDMLLEVIKVLEKSSEVLLQLQEKYQYILIDEHQDTNAAQNKLVELLANFYELPNLFVVGDEKQAIYRFQGASLENFLYFQKLYPQAKLINLRQNYRSHQLILDAAGGLIANNISSQILQQVSLEANSTAKMEKLEIVGINDFFGEYEWIAGDISKKVKAGIETKEIAVLGRRNGDLVEMASALGRNNIPFVMETDANIFADVEIQKLILLLQGIAYFGEDIYLARILQINFIKVDPLDVYKLINYARQSRQTITDCLYNIDTIPGISTPETLRGFAALLKSWVLLKSNIPFDDLFVKVINESGLRNNILCSPNSFESLEKLTGLYDEIKRKLYKNPEFGLEDFLHYLEVLKKHQVVLKARSKLKQTEGVRLLTVHKSKGLEFDCVYMLNCFDGRWGSSKKRPVKIKLPWQYLGEKVKTQAEFEEIEDERRLFYVGLTRARKKLVLTYTKYGLDGSEQLPSRFLEEIDTKLVDVIDATEFNKDFEMRKDKLFDDDSVEVSFDAKKEYLQQLFLEKGLSVSSLQNFLECPWKYFFVNLISLPAVKNRSQIFGTALHSALDFYIKNRDKNPSVEALIERFIQVIDSEALSKKDQNELSEKGRTVLMKYFNEVIPTWPEKIESELTVRGVKMNDHLVLNGRIDMLEDVDGKGNVKVYDFKSGKPKPRGKIDGREHSEEHYNYLRQLVFYKVLLERYKDKIHVIEGVIDFVESDEKGRFHKEFFDITDQHVKALENQLVDIGEQIYNLTFWNQELDHKKCEYCDLRKITLGE